MPPIFLHFINFSPGYYKYHCCDLKLSLIFGQFSDDEQSKQRTFWPIVNCCWLTHKKIPLKATFLDRRPPPCPSYSKQRDRQEREARGEHDAKKVWQKSLKSWSRFVSVIKVWTLTAGHHLWLAASFHCNLSKRHLPEFSIFGVLEENIVK